MKETLPLATIGTVCSVQLVERTTKEEY